MVEGVDSKFCSKCKTLKIFSEFYHSKRDKYGYKHSCKKCQAVEAKLWAENRKANILILKSKTCSDCNLEKDVCKFIKSQKSKDGYNPCCQECLAIKYREWRRIKSGIPKVTKSGTKVCCKCKIEKELKYFYKRAFMSDGCNSSCKKCNNKINRDKWYELKRKVLLKIIGSDKLECSCCNETWINVLEVDHIYNDGKQEREALNIYHDAFYRLVLNMEDVSKYQVLCRNCNWIKFTHGGDIPEERYKVFNKIKPEVRQLAGV